MRRLRAMARCTMIGTAFLVGLGLSTVSNASGDEALAAMQAGGDHTVLYGSLAGVGGSSHGDVWAVGQRYDNGKAAVEHFDGTDWTSVAIRGRVSRIDADLRSVSVNTETDAWAVGNTWGTGGRTKTLIVHWDGSAWRQSPSPKFGPGWTDLLLSVSADSATDAWAVGTYHNNHVFKPIALHWDGTTWTSVEMPAPGRFGTEPEAVTALSPSNAWAVGVYVDTGRTERTLVEHWDGTHWVIVDNPDPRGGDDELSGVSATSVTDAWAVGNYSPRGTSSQTLVYHWDGTSWIKVPSPSPGRYSALSSVSASSTDEAWAVGGELEGQQGPTLALHWDGVSWTKVTTPREPGALGSLLSDVATRNAKDATAVGYSVNNAHVPTAVLLHWNGTHWTRQ